MARDSSLVLKECRCSILFGFVVAHGSFFAVTFDSLLWLLPATHSLLELKTCVVWFSFKLFAGNLLRSKIIYARVFARLVTHIMHAVAYQINYPIYSSLLFSQNPTIAGLRFITITAKRIVPISTHTGHDQTLSLLSPTGYRQTGVPAAAISN